MLGQFAQAVLKNTAMSPYSTKKIAESSRFLKSRDSYCYTSGIEYLGRQESDLKVNQNILAKNHAAVVREEVTFSPDTFVTLSQCFFFNANVNV